jgi:hypothetical protein
MITNGSLRLLYLILDECPSWLMLLGRARGLGAGSPTYSHLVAQDEELDVSGRTLIERLARETDLGLPAHPRQPLKLGHRVGASPEQGLAFVGLGAGHREPDWYGSFSASAVAPSL